MQIPKLPLESERAGKIFFLLIADGDQIAGTGSWAKLGCSIVFLESERKKERKRGRNFADLRRSMQPWLDASISKLLFVNTKIYYELV